MQHCLLNGNRNIVPPKFVYLCPEFLVLCFQLSAGGLCNRFLQHLKSIMVKAEPIHLHSWPSILPAVSSVTMSNCSLPSLSLWRHQPHLLTNPLHPDGHEFCRVIFSLPEWSSARILKSLPPPTYLSFILLPAHNCWNETNLATLLLKAFLLSSASLVE